MEEGCLELLSVKVEIFLFMINNIVDNDFLGNCQVLSKYYRKNVLFLESLGLFCRLMIG